MRQRSMGAVLFVLLVSAGMTVGPCKRGLEPVSDLIPLIQLQAGVADTLVAADLFYAKRYALSFEPHAQIDAEFLPESGQVVLKARSDFEGLALLKARQGRERIVLPVRSRIVPEHRFQLTPGGHPTEVTVFGGFNSWNRHNLPMTDSNGDGTFDCSVSLEPGRYEYRFYVDGQERIDAGNPKRVPNPFGEFNSLIEVAPRHTGRLHVHHLARESRGDSLMIRFAVTQNGRPFDVNRTQVLALVGNSILPEAQIHVEGSTVTLCLAMERAGTVRCAVSSGGNVSLFQQARLGPDQPAWAWRDAVMYSMMIDRFSDGDPGNNRPISHPELADQANYHGGDLQGIIDKMDEGYFDSLGVNVLWLFPVNDNPDQPYQEFPEPHRWFTGYHGYWPVHPRRIESRFGNIELFKSLVDKAHARGYRVLLDFVANHVHENHPFYVEHPEWFGQLNLPDGRKNIRHWDEYRLTTWFDTFLPSFDYLGSDEALEAMTDNAVWWLKETGIDGFRQDAVKHIPNRFWRALKRKIAQQIEVPQQRKVYQIGETFGGYDLVSSYVNNGQLDAQFNFQIYDVGQYIFLTPGTSFEVLDSEMQRTFAVYGMHHLMGNLMDSHDKVRFMAQADGDVPLGDALATEKAWTDRPRVDHASSYEKAKLYLAFVLTIPGVPVIYYGDEIGLTGAADPDNRRPMRFADALKPIEEAMKANVSQLIQLRRDHSALRHGDMVTLKAEGDIYAYVRSDTKERVLVVLNKGEKAQAVTLQLPAFYGTQEVVSLLDHGGVQIEGQRLRLNVPPLGAGIYRLK